MNKILFMFGSQTDCKLLSKFSVIYYSQLLPRKEDIPYHCYKLWRSIASYKDSNMETRFFYEFCNQVYDSKTLTLYIAVKFHIYNQLRKILIRQICGIGDDSCQCLNKIFAHPEKLVSITEI